MRYLTLEEFAQLPDDESTYLIDRFVPFPGKIQLVGPPKKGKTFLALQMALAVAQGVPFLGRPSVKARVLFLQYDMTLSQWRGRMKDLLEAKVDLSGDFVVLHPEDSKPRLDVLRCAADIAYLHQVLESVKPKLVIIDCLKKLHSGNENASEVMDQVFTILNDIFKHCAVIYVHHTHKLSPPPGMKMQHRPSPSDSARGSSYISGEVDATYLLYGKYLSTDCRFDESTEYEVHRDPLTKLWIFPEAERLVNLDASIRKEFATRSWDSWFTFSQHAVTTFPYIPDHLLRRLKRELEGTCGAASPADESAHVPSVEPVPVVVQSDAETTP